MTAPKSTSVHRRRRWPAPWLLPLCLGLTAAAGVTHLRAAREFKVAKPTENIRATPEGRQLGTLMEGAAIEELGRDGKWLRFRLEGWIWGPSLEGWEPAPPAAGRSKTADGADRSDARETGQRQPRQALSVHLDEIRELVNDRFGRFYGMRLDPDLEQVQVRLRVRDLEREAFERRQMRLQHHLLEILEDDTEFASLRIESNRPDGTGEVGLEMAATATQDVRRVAGQDLDLWRQVTRRTSDGGQSWTGPETLGP